MIRLLLKNTGYKNRKLMHVREGTTATVVWKASDISFTNHKVGKV